MAGGLGDCRMKTSSSLTEEWIWTLVSSERNFDTWQGVSAMPSLLVLRGRGRVTWAKVRGTIGESRHRSQVSAWTPS